jgi:pantetheine-phosphate adenylyltransferase
MTQISPNGARTALFAGSFNPFTIGHASVVERALGLFDRIVVAVGVNAAKADADVEARLEAIRAVYANEPRVEVVAYSNELTVDLAKRLGAKWLLRGVRSVKDFEYERDMADMNRQLSGVETVLLYSLPEYSAISSSVVRELKAYGRDVSEFLPKIP